MENTINRIEEIETCVMNKKQKNETNDHESV